MKNIGIKKIIFYLLTIFFVVSFFSSCFSESSANFKIENQEAPSPKKGCEADIETENGLNDSAYFFIDSGIIEPDKYRAENYLSRKIAVQLISDLTGLGIEAEKSSYTHPFIDISDNVEKQISYLYFNEIVDGVTNNKFMEDEICNLDSFLVFFLRALNFIGGQQGDVNTENARQEAVNRGIISSEYGGGEDGVLSVNEAFDICRTALYTYINEQETLFTYLSDKKIALIPEGGDNEAYEIFGEQLVPFFEETFNDKKMDGYDVADESGRTYWSGSRVKGAYNEITQDGYLQLAGKEQELVSDQQISLKKYYMKENENYGMTFKVNVQSLGNEGDEGRVVFRVIPRTADEDFTKYYAINYYMVSPLGNYQSNLIRCKWSITNTNAPTDTQPLVESFYLLKENVDYGARVLIENTDDGNVHIEFYIDGADHYSTELEPLMEYTDTSDYKILESVQGPAFGNSGYKHFGWGYSSSIKLDDIKLYTPENFNLQTEQFKKFSNTQLALRADDDYTSQLRYLVNKGVIKPYQRHLEFASVVSVEQFLASSMYLNESYMKEGQTLEEFVMDTYLKLFKGMESEANLDLSRNITRYESALIIKKMMQGQPGTKKYHSLFSDKLNEDYLYSVYFAVQNSYLFLDENNKFNGDEFLARQDMLKIFSCAVDASLRNKNYRLQLPGVFSDYGILQGDKPIPISGRGMNGDTVTVEFNGQKKTAKVVDGEWLVELESMPYGGPYDLVVKDSGYTYTAQKLYVGEVFIVAGQSNAEWSVYESEDNQDTLIQFNNSSSLRLFRPVSRTATTPYYDTETNWQVAFSIYSEYVMGTSSAIAVFCVQKLLEINPELKSVKMGLIQITYGGTSIEMFLPNCVGEKNKLNQNDNELISSGFWNGYMDSITPYSAKAIIYYQGENSAHLEYQYEPMLRDYIWGIREELNDPSIPIMLVQLTGYGDNYGQDYDSWPKIREIQMRVANTTKNVGLVTAVDLSDKDILNIHPTKKRPIGDRLAYLAMDLVYGKDYGKQSPSMTSYTLEGNVYSIKFDSQEVYINENVYGDIDFEILTAEKKWVSAQAKIEDNTLLVWAENTNSPLGVRYAWANYPKASLFNEYDLPVFPFDTTKDLNKIILAKEFTTNEHYLKKAYHLLNNNDVIINITRDNAFRYVTVINAYLMEYDEDIENQAPGDQIVLLKKQDNQICEIGTNETIVTITGHGLKVGDWIKNTKYDALREVLEVIDENTFLVKYVENQASGNVFEVFKNTGEVTAQK